MLEEIKLGVDERIEANPQLATEGNVRVSQNFLLIKICINKRIEDLKANVGLDTWFSSAWEGATFESSFLARLDLSFALPSYLDRTWGGKSSSGTTPSIPWSVNCNDIA